ncbi:MFS transporter, partial [Methylobacterium sp. WL18]
GSPGARAAGADRGGVLRAAAPLMGIGFALTLGLGQIQIVLGLFLQKRFNLDAPGAAGLAGATFALVAVTMILTQLVLVPRLGPNLRRNLSLGLAGFAAGAGVTACAPAAWVAVLGTVVVGAGIALATPHYTAALVARMPGHAQA